MVCTKCRGSETMDSGYSWLVFCVAFIGQAMSVGFYFCFGPIYVEILYIYQASETEAAWIGSIGYSVCFMFGFLSCSLCDRFGCGSVMSAGGALIGIGMIVSSFAPNTMTLFVSYGIIISLGTSCLFFSSLLALPLYFKKRLGFANGLASAGSGVGGITLSPFFAFLIKYLGLKSTFQIYAIFTLLPILGGFFIRRKSYGTKKKKSMRLSGCFDRALLRNKAFILFTIAMSPILFAYYIPYVHLINFSRLKGVKSEHAALLPSIISASAVLGKVVFGYISQFQVNRLYLFQTFLLLLSVSLTLLPLATNYLMLGIFSFVFGLCEGGFSCYIIIVTSQIVHTKQLAVGFGMMYTVTSFFSILGPPFAAFIFVATGSYEMAFISGGAILMSGALSLFCIPFLIPDDVYLARLRLKNSKEHESDVVDVATEEFSCTADKPLIVEKYINFEAETATSETMEVEINNSSNSNNNSIDGKNKSLNGKNKSLNGAEVTIFSIIDSI